MTPEHHAFIDMSDFEREAPDVLAALGALGKAVDNAGLDKSLTELLKVRASQLNGCAFCLQYHLNYARKLRVTPAKLDLVATWLEVGLYSARERAALAWTEALTSMPARPVSDADYADVQAQFSKTEVAFLTMAIGAINAWNRIAGGLRFSPPIPADRLD